MLQSHHTFVSFSEEIPRDSFLLVHLFLSINFYWFGKILLSIFWKSLFQRKSEEDLMLIF